MTTPKPCPFCGAQFELRGDLHRLQHTDECFFRYVHLVGFQCFNVVSQGDIDAWNRRYTEDDVPDKPGVDN